MVTICQTCGDKGYSEALVYCKHCRVYAVHRYCLDVLPPTFVEPVTWFCDDCEIKMVKPSSLDNLSHSEKMAKKKKHHRRSKDIEEDKTAKSSKSEACRPESNATTELLEVACEESPDKDKGLGGKGPQDTVSSDEKAETDGDKPSPELFYYGPAQPIIEPIWRGSFNLLLKNFDTVGGLFGHLSNLACPKACKAAKLLPEVLCPELLPKSDVWPKSFQERGPSDENIALFFFPNNGRPERTFNSLVDVMIKNDLAMRAVVEDVELLIFTSLVLPMPFWRFQEKFYLWGVFKGKQVLQTEVPQEKNNSSVSETDSKCGVSLSV